MKSRANEDIRRLERESGVAQWQVAARLNVSESTLIKKMRFELPPDAKAQIRKIVDELKEG